MALTNFKNKSCFFFIPKILPTRWASGVVANFAIVKIGRVFINVCFHKTLFNSLLTFYQV